MDDSTNFKIEKDVPYPIPQRRRKYPFQEMEIGDSFQVAFSDISASSLRYTASQYGLRNNKKFSVRKLNKNFCRCWRIE